MQTLKTLDDVQYVAPLATGHHQITVLADYQGVQLCILTSISYGSQEAYEAKRGAELASYFEVRDGSATSHYGQMNLDEAVAAYAAYLRSDMMKLSTEDQRREIYKQLR